MAGLGQRAKGRPRNISPAKENPRTLERINAVLEMRSRGQHMVDIAAQLGVSVRTVNYDWQRAVELYREATVANVDAHVARLERLLVKAWKMLEESDSRSLNRSAILGQIRQTVMDIAKLDGSLIERKEVDGTLTVRDLIASTREGPWSQPALASLEQSSDGQSPELPAPANAWIPRRVT